MFTVKIVIELEFNVKDAYFSVLLCKTKVQEEICQSNLLWPCFWSTFEACWDRTSANIDVLEANSLHLEPLKGQLIDRELLVRTDPVDQRKARKAREALISKIAVFLDELNV